MQHAGLQYGQGAANSHQSPPFAHADISFSKQQTTTGGNTTSSLRQFRKKEGLEKTSGTDLNHSINENSHIARVAPHNHYPARPNDYYRYHSQYPDYNSSYKEPIAQVKYSEIAETPPQAIQHVDHIPTALQKHKEPHKDFMDMCNISQQTHMKQNYPDNLSRQQSYPPDAASMHHQYLHKEPQVHPNYKPESQYQQYPQLAKYNMPSQCRKYQPPPPHENEFLARLQQINPSMARSIMSDHHVRDSQTTNYPNQLYPQNQRYYPTHLQNNPAYPNYHMSQPYNYPSSCNYKHPDYARANQMGGTQYPTPDRSLSPRNLHMNYGTAPQKISPGYGQYNPPEYAQHYQHRRASVPQEYYQQCRNNPYVPNHQISPQTPDNRASSGLRHFIENWAEEEGVQDIAPIYKENVRIHNEAEQVFVINSSELPQCLENVSLVPTENGQYIIKSSALDNSVVRIKETTENNGERTVNLQIVEATPKPDCMLAETAPLLQETAKPNEEPTTVPYVENQTTKDCDEASKTVDRPEEEEQPVSENAEKNETTEASVIVCNEVSVIKDMPLIEEDHDKKAPQEDEELTPATQEPEVEEETTTETPQEENEEKEPAVLPLDNHVTSTTKRTQRIFSVDDIINNIGNSGAQPRRNSVQLMETYDDNTEEAEDKIVCASEEQKPEEDPPPPEEEEEGVEYASAISIEDDSVILEIGGALVQLNINHCNGTKVLSVLPLSESLVIDVNGNYQNCVESMTQEDLECETPCEEKTTATEGENDKTLSEERNEESVQENVEEVDKEMVEVSNNDKVDEGCEEIVEKSNEDKVDAMEQDQHQEEVQQQLEEEIDTTVCQSEVVIGDESEENEVFIDLNSNREEKFEKELEEVKEAKCEEIPPQAIQHVDHTFTEKVIERVKETEETKEVEKHEEVEEDKTKPVEIIKKKEKKTHLEEKKKYKEIEEEKKPSSSKKVKDHERKLSEERVKPKKAIPKGDEEETKTTKKVKIIPNEDETKTIKKSKVIPDEEENKAIKKRIEEKPKEEESKKEEVSKKDEKIEKPSPCVSTKAAKKHYVTDSPVKKQPKEKETKSKTDEKPSKLKIDVKKSMAQLEETVNKIKSLKEKASKKENKPKESPEIPEKKPKTPKRVTFNLEIHEISKEEIDRKKLSLEEYNIRKRKSPLESKEDKIMENTVTSSEDIGDHVVEQVEQSIENAIKDSALKISSPKVRDNNWEDDPDSPKTSEKSEVMSKSKRCIIDVNEFNIKPIESVSTPSPVSSSQFSYHSEDDSLQVYKDVVDSKLNSLNIKIPKVSKPKALDQVSELLERFLNKSSLNCNELEKVKKIIEFKRKIEEKQLTYEVREEREYKDLKLHFKKVQEKRPKKRFRNLYTEDTSSEDSDSSRSDKAVGDYSVYQRSSHQGVPKLIFKRNSGLPQPFVKLERSQAVELLAKKRKLY